MLESLNDYISFIVLLIIIISFLIMILSSIFKSIERSRIRRAMIRREKEQKGEA